MARNRKIPTDTLPSNWSAIVSTAQEFVAEETRLEDTRRDWTGVQRKNLFEFGDWLAESFANGDPLLTKLAKEIGKTKDALNRTRQTARAWDGDLVSYRHLGDDKGIVVPFTVYRELAAAKNRDELFGELLTEASKGDREVSVRDVKVKLGRAKTGVLNLTGLSQDEVAEALNKALEGLPIDVAAAIADPFVLTEAEKEIEGRVVPLKRRNPRVSEDKRAAGEQARREQKSTDLVLDNLRKAKELIAASTAAYLELDEAVRIEAMFHDELIIRVGDAADTLSTLSKVTETALDEGIASLFASLRGDGDGEAQTG